MSEESSTGGVSSAAVLQSMTLLATLSTATDVCSSVARRRAGRDLSAQEPTERAAAGLRNSGRDLMDVLMQLALSRVPLDEGDEQLSTAVRQFDLLTKLRRAQRLVQRMHQRLLSLYPEVSEELVEEARTLEAALGRFLAAAGEDEEGPALTTLIERGISFVVWMRHEVPLSGPGH